MKAIDYRGVEKFLRTCPKPVAPYLKDHHLEGLFGIRERQAWQSLWNTEQITELHAIGMETARAGLRVTVLKGGALLQSLYKQIGHRFMSDVDLLVSPGQMSEVVEILVRMGFARYEEDLWEASAHKVTFVRRNKHDIEIAVEVHSQLYYQFKSEWPETRDSEIPGLQYLDFEWELFYLIVHAGFQHTFESCRWFVDIDLYVRTHSDRINWKKLYRIASNENMVRYVEATFHILERDFGNDVAREQVSSFENSVSSMLIKKVMDREFVWKPKSRKLRFFFLKHFLKSSFIRNFKYDFYWFKSWAKKYLSYV